MAQCVFRLFSIVLLVASALGGRYAWAGKASTIVYCAEGSPQTFNPALSIDATTHHLNKDIYNRLVRLSVDDGKVEPDLAESWTVSDDGKVIQFRLRKNVSFHTTEYFKPTRKLNADDVVFFFLRQLKKDHPFHLVGDGKYLMFQSNGLDKVIEDVVKVSDLEVKFILNKPFAPLLPLLSAIPMGITSKEYADHLAAADKKVDYDQKPVGTGPMIFKSYVPDQRIRLTANPQYFLGKPKFDQFVFEIVPEGNVRMQMMRVGSCHIAFNPPVETLKYLKDEPQLQVVKRPGVNVGYVGLNIKKRPFDNVKVRQALNYALNREAYIKAIYHDNAKLADTPLSAVSWAHKVYDNRYSYDLAKAKQLLKEAGFPNGFSTELWTLPIDRPYIPNGKKLGEMIQADLAKLNISVRLVSYDWGTYLEKSEKGEHHMVMLGWMSDLGDPDIMLGNNLSCNTRFNVSQWCDKSFQALLEKARSTNDQAERQKMYQEAIGIFIDQAPWIPIAHGNYTRVISQKLKGYKFSSYGYDIFDDARIEF